MLEQKLEQFRDPAKHCNCRICLEIRYMRDLISRLNLPGELEGELIEYLAHNWDVREDQAIEIAMSQMQSSKNKAREIKRRLVK